MNGDGDQETQHSKIEPVNCPLWGKKCVDVNQPVRQCDWYITIMMPHPKIAGQVTSAQTCKLDAILMGVGGIQQVLAMMRQPPPRLFRSS